MFVYWLLFAYFGLGAILSRPSEGNRGRLTPMLLFGAVLMTVIVGFRYEVGGDWYAYRMMLHAEGGGKLATAQDPAYQLVNWLAYQADLRIWAVNLVCGAIFTWGLFRFCLIQTEPWLALLIAVPYMVIVVAMGYTRQAVALGILMAGLASVARGASTVKFGVYTLFAALFHRTAVVAMPLIALASRRNRLINIIIGLCAGVLLYDVFLGSSIDTFFRNYVHAGYSSSGAGIRLAMTLVAALFFAIANRRLGFSEIEWNIWRNFSWASVVALVFLLASPSSTAVDRISLYVMPLQIAVLSRVPSVSNPAIVGRFLVILYLAAVEFVWLNFGQFASAWVPYKFFPL